MIGSGSVSEVAMSFVAVRIGYLIVGLLLVIECAVFANMGGMASMEICVLRLCRLV